MRGGEVGVDPLVFQIVFVFVIICLVSILAFVWWALAPSEEALQAEQRQQEKQKDKKEKKKKKKGGLRRRRRRVGVRGDDEQNPEEDAQDGVEIDQRETEARRIKKKEIRAAQRRHEAEVAERKKAKEKARREREEAKRQKEAEKDAAQNSIDSLYEQELERKRKEREKAEEETYNEWKEQIVVEKSGTSALSKEEKKAREDAILKEVKEKKVVKVEELGSKFKMKPGDIVRLLTKLGEEGRLTGVVDDLGKYIFISEEELENVAQFIERKGRISIVDFANEIGSLIKIEE